MKLIKQFRISNLKIEGTLLYVGVEEGASAAVDSVLAIIGNEGEDISGLTGGAAAPSAGSEEKKSEEQPKTEAAEPVAAAEVPAGVEVITMPRLSDTMTEGKSS